MKKNSNRRFKTARTVRPLVFPCSTLDASLGVDVCHNLRYNPLTAGLEAVGIPGEFSYMLSGEGEFVEGGVFHHADGEVSHLIARGRELLVAKGRSRSSLGELGGEPLTAIPLSDGFVVMTTAGPRRLRYASGVWAETPLADDYPHLMLEARAAGSVSINVDTALSGTYDRRSTALDYSDSVTAGREAAYIYRWLANRAMTSRRFIQPVMASYRLIGMNGEVLYSSCPRLLTPDAGVQLTSMRFNLTGEYLNRISDTRISAETYSIGVRMTQAPTEVWRATVRSVEILVSPQLHPLAEGTNACQCPLGEFDAAGSRGVLTVHLPGVSTALKPCEPGGWLHTKVLGVLSRMEISMRCAATLTPAEAGTEGCTVPATDPALERCEEEMDRLDTIFASPLPAKGPAAEMKRRLSAPHHMCARTGSRDGDIVMWGDLTATLFEGYSVAEMTVAARQLSEGAVPTASSVTTGRGKCRQVKALTMRRLEPEALSPLIVYPDGEASELTVTTPDATLKFPLKPSPCGAWSYWLNPDGLPVEIHKGTQDAFAVPAALPQILEWEDAVAVAHVDAPLMPLAVAQSGTGGVRALAPGRRAGSSMELTRTRFHAFGPSGIASVTVGSDRTRLTSTVIDNRGVECAAAVASTSSGVAAVAAGVPVIVSGNRVTTLCKGFRATRLGWNAPRGELWIFGVDGYTSGDTDDMAVVLDMATGRFHTRSVGHVISMASIPSGLRMITAGGRMLDAGTETGAEDVDVEYCVRIPSDGSPGEWRDLSVGITGEIRSGSLALRGDCGMRDDGSPAIVALGITGPLYHPVVHRLMHPHVHFLTLVIKAKTGKPFSIFKIR